MHGLDLPGTIALFTSRLDTLAHLLSKAEAHFGADHSFLDGRVAPDMLPFRTQVFYACNQPHNFALWCGASQPPLQPSSDAATLEQVRGHVEATKALVLSLGNIQASVPKRARIVLGPKLHAEMPAYEYVNDFLVPNLYFHLVTAYAILRMAGLPIGKADYMQHMRDLVVQDSP